MSVSCVFTFKNKYICRIILGQILPFHCRLPTAIRSKLPFADGNEKHGKTTSIISTGRHNAGRAKNGKIVQQISNGAAPFEKEKQF